MLHLLTVSALRFIAAGVTALKSLELKIGLITSGESQYRHASPFLANLDHSFVFATGGSGTGSEGCKEFYKITAIHSE